MKWKTALILIATLLLSVIFTAWLIAPRVEKFEPAASPLHGQQQLSLSFSRPMNPETVESNISFEPPIQGDFTWNETLDRVIFSPHKSWPSGDTITVQVKSGARSNFRLPLLGEKSWTLAVSPTLLVYLWPADGKSNLYQTNPETGENQTLTSEKNGVLDYSVTPDGLRILYSVLDENGDSLIVSLDRLTGTTSTLIECSPDLCRSPQISPNGVYLAYSFISRDSKIQPGVRVYNLDNDTAIILGDPEDSLDHILWSPAGWLSYYSYSQQRYVFWNPISSRELTLPNETGGDGSWSGDGRYFISSEILFISDTLAPRHLMLFDLSEETLVDLSQGNFLEDLNPSFSHLGLFLAFSRKSLDPQEWSPGRQLWILDLDGGEGIPLTSSVDYHHTSFIWHPDDSALAYVRYNQAKLSDPPEIWLINPDGTDNLRLIINGFAPAWIP
ncbi:MAG: Ig-like domain-containing protein [Anaerolineales bacterium]|nr:Ig-like domain-containing protein [Anaerolineales bacterium]